MKDANVLSHLRPIVRCETLAERAEGAAEGAPLVDLVEVRGEALHVLEGATAKAAAQRSVVNLVSRSYVIVP